MQIFHCLPSVAILNFPLIPTPVRRLGSNTSPQRENYVTKHACFVFRSNSLFLETKIYIFARNGADFSTQGFYKSQNVKINDRLKYKFGTSLRAQKLGFRASVNCHKNNRGRMTLFIATLSGHSVAHQIKPIIKTYSRQSGKRLIAACQSPTG